MAKTNSPGRWEYHELFSSKAVDVAIDELVDKAIEKYKGLDPVFVAYLHGALPFASRLMAGIEERDPEFNPVLKGVVFSSYTRQNVRGQLKVVTDLPPREKRTFPGRLVVGLDDLMDSGNTLAFGTKHFQDMGASAVEHMVLVKKLVADPAYDGPLMYGLEAENLWLSGMGMDNPKDKDEKRRWAGNICVAEFIPD